MSTKPKLDDNTVYLIDGSGYIFRAFFAMPSLHNKKGVPTNAVFGFTNMLLKLLAEHRPKMLAIAFDRKEPTFRHRIYPQYKANRPEPPKELIPQFALIHDVVSALGIKSFSIPGVEADDIIGSLASKAKNLGHEVVMVSGDKDFMQLIEEGVFLLDELRAQKTGKEQFFGKNEVKEELGIWPDQVIDMLALMGDTSDNIPGIAGIGPKTAVNLLSEFGTLDKILECSPLIKQKSVKEKVISGRENAILSKKLVSIDRNIDLDISVQDLIYHGVDESKVRELFLELDFNKFLHDGRLPLKNKTQVINQITQKNILNILEKKDFLSATKIALYINDNLLLVAGDNNVLLETDLSVKNLKILVELSKEGKLLLGYDVKNIYKIFNKNNLDINISGDIKLQNYLLYQDSKKLDLSFNDHAQIAQEILKTHEILNENLKKNGLEKLYTKLELPLEPILAHMEEAGVKIDQSVLKSLREDLIISLKKLEQEAYKLAGESFNLLSPKQVGEILFEKLQLKTIKKTKTGYSTDQAVLEKLKDAHPICEILLKYRMYAKLMNTYVESLPKLIDQKTARVHTNFNQFVTATGRLSSSDPNLQNIPIRTVEGRKIREAFIAENGFKLISLDYSQVELRLLAYVSQDPLLIDSFKKDQDVHKRTASEIFDVEQNSVSKEQRNVAKTINFGLLYGMGVQKLAATLNISFKEAKIYLEKYFNKYQGIVRWKERALIEAREKKEVKTLYGRRRLLPEFLSQNPIDIARAERLAINTPIQGTAADIIKMAMIKVDEYIKINHPSSRLILQVHDELVIEAKEDDAEEIAVKVSKIMSEASGFSDLYLKVDFGIGSNWQQAH